MICVTCITEKKIFFPQLWVQITSIVLNFLKNIFSNNSPGIEEALLNGAIILDVRTAKEFDGGHIRGSKNISLHELKSKIELIRKWKKPVITVCFSGSRSRIAQSILSSAGIEAYNGGSWMTFNK